MNPEESSAWEHAPGTDAGKSPLERSGSGLLPASPPEAPGVPTPLPPPVAPAPPADDVWEDGWPRPPVDEEDETSPLPDSLSWGQDVPPPVVRTRHRGTLRPGAERPHMPISPQQKLLLLDTWQRSGLPARDFAALVNVSHHTLYSWKKRFEELGPGGLVDQPKGSKKGSKLPELNEAVCTAGDELSDTLKAAHHRRAVRHVLVERGYLDITRRSVPQPLPPRKCARIT